MKQKYIKTFKEFVNEDFFNEDYIDESKLTTKIKNDKLLISEFIISNYAWRLPGDGNDYTYKDLLDKISAFSGAQHKFIKKFLKSNPNTVIQATQGIRNDILYEKWKINEGDIIQLGDFVSTSDMDYMYAEGQQAFVTNTQNTSFGDYEVLPINVSDSWDTRFNFNHDLEYQDKYYWTDIERIGYNGKSPNLANTMNVLTIYAVDVANVVKRNASFYNFLMQIRNRTPDIFTWIKRNDFPEIAKTKLMIK